MELIGQMTERRAARHNAQQAPKGEYIDHGSIVTQASRGAAMRTSSFSKTIR